jgi:hypothetical protein
MYTTGVRPRSFAAVSILLVPWTAAGCGAELPNQYETAHLRIHTDSDYPLCKGDLLALEDLVHRVEQELAVEMKGVSTIYMWHDETWFGGPHENCPANTGGCINPMKSTVWTSRSSLEHEIVHAVVGRNKVSPFFDEALADIYRGDQTRFGRSAPSANEGKSDVTVDRGTGRHFVRWLRERWGAQRLAQLVNAGRTFKNFESVYGMSLEAAEELYFNEAPYGYPAMYACQSPEIVWTSDGLGWAEEIVLDCAEGEDVRSHGGAIGVERTFLIREAGLYTFDTNAYWFELYRCSGPRIEDPPHPLDYLEDAPAHHTSYPSGASRFYIEQPRRDLYLEAGLHNISFGLFGYDGGSVRLAITPALGPRPAPLD